MKRLWLISTLFMSLPLAYAQTGQPPQGGPGGPPPDGRKWERRGPGGERGERMPMGMMGMWWKNPEIAQKIGLTDDQSQRIEKAFVDFRSQLISLHEELTKQEQALRPLLDADTPDEAKVMAQVDRVAQARANLEKANAQMMLAIRRVLTPEQWKKLQEGAQERRHGFGEGRPDGPPPQPRNPGGED